MEAEATNGLLLVECLDAADPPGPVGLTDMSARGSGPVGPRPAHRAAVGAARGHRAARSASASQPSNPIQPGRETVQGEVHYQPTSWTDSTTNRPVITSDPAHPRV